jgi:hypothetical protein
MGPERPSILRTSGEPALGCSWLSKYFQSSRVLIPWSFKSLRKVGRVTTQILPSKPTTRANNPSQLVTDELASNVFPFLFHDQPQPLISSLSIFLPVETEATRNHRNRRPPPNSILRQTRPQCRRRISFAFRRLPAASEFRRLLVV